MSIEGETKIEFDKSFKYDLDRWMKGYALSATQIQSVTDAVSIIIDRKMSALNSKMARALRSQGQKHGNQLAEVEAEIKELGASLESEYRNLKLSMDSEIRLVLATMKIEDDSFKQKFAFIEGMVKVVIPSVIAILGLVLTYALAKD